ncbi:MAG: hypothetical protein ACK5DD_15065 [Cyclobacteriaceae bacterium]|jgi:hypothetical protein
MVRLLLFCFSWIIPVQQDTNFWHILAEVGFEQKKDQQGYIVDVPRFSQHLKGYQGKKIRLKGYVIPAGEVGDVEKFMFSSLPFNVCYFCGAAGPETVVEVETTEKIKFSPEAIWMEGILKLNDHDPDHHIYLLQQAKVVKK